MNPQPEMSTTNSNHSSNKSDLRRSCSLPTTTTASTSQQQEQQSTNNNKKATTTYSSNNNNSTTKPPPTIQHSKSEDNVVISIQNNNNNKNNNSNRKVDRFGFYINDDENINNNTNNGGGGGTLTMSGTERLAKDINNTTNTSSYNSNTLTKKQQQQIQGRIMKWNVMIKNWDIIKNRKQKLIKKRLRKGLPDSERAKIWPILCNVHEKIKQHPNLYKQLVQNSTNSTSSTPKQSTTTTNNNNSPTNNNISNNTPGSNTKNNNSNKKNNSSSSSSSERAAAATTIKTSLSFPPFDHTKSFRQIQETIERDIHRTFPRHCLFSDNDDDDDGDDDNNNNNNVNKESPNNNKNTTATSTPSSSIGNVIENAIGNAIDNAVCSPLTKSATMTSLPATPLLLSPSTTSDYNNNNNSTNTNAILYGVSGQARLRRVLKAYSVYDREIGYCQGMNFIAAMFLTLMDEEQAFWMLVGVMYDRPCQLRGLFGEGMKETHKVLYISEKLIEQFLPKLYKHLHNESIHITMYATQWLLTQYTSSYPFVLVTRIWDIFLYEGWKITYRIMLSILQYYQSTLLHMPFEEILTFFRTLPERDDLNTNKIISDAINIPLKTKHVMKYEKEYNNKQQQ